VANDIDAYTEDGCKETFCLTKQDFGFYPFSNNTPLVCGCETMKMLNWEYFFGRLLYGKGSAELNHYPVSIKFINYCPQRFS
jgi:hypothetical protein